MDGLPRLLRPSHEGLELANLLLSYRALTKRALLSQEPSPEALLTLVPVGALEGPLQGRERTLVGRLPPLLLTSRAEGS